MELTISFFQPTPLPSSKCSKISLKNKRLFLSNAPTRVAEEDTSKTDSTDDNDARAMVSVEVGLSVDITSKFCCFHTVNNSWNAVKHSVILSIKAIIKILYTIAYLKQSLVEAVIHCH